MLEPGLYVWTLRMAARSVYGISDAETGPCVCARTGSYFPKLSGSRAQQVCWWMCYASGVRRDVADVNTLTGIYPGMVEATSGFTEC